MRRAVVCLLGAVVLLAACGGGGGGSDTELAQAPTPEGFGFTTGSAVAEGKPIEVRFTCDGDDVSPELAWTGIPEGTQQLALVMEDPDAPGATFTHWLLWDLAPDVTGLPEGVVAEGEVAGPPALRQGENDSGRVGYAGPCPPEGEQHDYVFRLLALHPMELEAGADRAAFDEAVAPHVLAETRLTATYERK